MKILVTGGTGFVGSLLVKRLLEGGDTVRVVSRDAQGAKSSLPTGAEAVTWEDPQLLAGIDAVIHLAGAGVADKRWSAERKKEIYDSRVKSSKALVDAVLTMQKPPKIFVSASAIGFYGDRGEESLDEKSARGSGFLADVCSDWEKELERLPKIVRRASVRIGLVLGKSGGAMQKMLPLFKKGVGGPLGSGKQWVSWIHVDDLVSLIIFILRTPTASGVLNGVGPEPVTNAVFTKALGKAVKKPAFLPAPAFALKLALGEMAGMLLGSQKIYPKRALLEGFKFKYPTIDSAFSEIVS